LGWRRH